MTTEQTQPRWFLVRHGLIDSYTFPEYGTVSRFVAAELSGENGAVYADVKEPFERAEDSAWEREEDFQQTLRDWAAWLAPTCEPAQPIYLVVDPGRDQQTTELVWEPEEEITE